MLRSMGVAGISGPVTNYIRNLENGMTIRREGGLSYNKKVWHHLKIVPETKLFGVITTLLYLCRFYRHTVYSKKTLNYYDMNNYFNLLI